VYVNGDVEADGEHEGESEDWEVIQREQGSQQEMEEWEDIQGVAQQ
jgi:hypothetical protein